MSLFWIEYVDDAEVSQGVGIVNAPDLTKAMIVAHHVGLPVDYRMHVYGPFRVDSVATAYWDRLLPMDVATELDLSAATVDERVFDFYSDVPREPHAGGDPDRSSAAGAEAATQDAG